jgi:hypothetical protein
VAARIDWGKDVSELWASGGNLVEVSAPALVQTIQRKETDLSRWSMPVLRY